VKKDRHGRETLGIGRSLDPCLPLNDLSATFYPGMERKRMGIGSDDHIGFNAPARELDPFS
jgi:hypothetical protein